MERNSQQDHKACIVLVSQNGILCLYVPFLGFGSCTIGSLCHIQNRLSFRQFLKNVQILLFLCCYVSHYCSKLWKEMIKASLRVEKPKNTVGSNYIPYSWKIRRGIKFGRLCYNRQIKIRQNILLAYMANLY